MDATVAAGGRPAEPLEGLFIAASLRIAASNEGGHVPSPAEAAGLFGSTGVSIFWSRNCSSPGGLPLQARSRMHVEADVRLWYATTLQSSTAVKP